jgi:hypothetical protein
MVPVDGVSAGTGGEDDQGPVAPAPLLTGNTANPSDIIAIVIYQELLVQLVSKGISLISFFY